jgi:endonuclease/exonuclease/phosphatase family metal-dependent hydrolase
MISNKGLLSIAFYFFLSFNLKAQEQEGVIIKVLSFNILHGATTEGNFDLDTIASVIKATQPDFVALQEVDFRTRRARDYDLATELGWRTKMAPLFGRAMPYDGGEYGEGVLSRHTLLSSKNVPLPHSPGNEPRAALYISTVLPSGDTLAFVGTHLEHQRNSTDRVDQAKAINAAFLPSEWPIILAGDLNDIPGSAPIQILESEWKASYALKGPVPTYPSEAPNAKIDYVMVYPAHRWEILDTEVICDTVASDHCAYLVTLKLLPSGK